MLEKDPKKLLKELQIKSEQLDKEVQAFYDELGITPEAIKLYFDTPENFTSEEWEYIQSEMREFREKLDRERENVPNPKKSREAMAERGDIERSWLFVR